MLYDIYLFYTSQVYQKHVIEPQQDFVPNHRIFSLTIYFFQRKKEEFLCLSNDIILFSHIHCHLTSTVFCFMTNRNQMISFIISQGQFIIVNEAISTL
jgi:hypothetical protein